MDTLMEMVSVAYRNAHENGFYLDELTAREVAEDMQHKDGDIENFHIDAIEQAVKAVREERKNRGL